MKALQALETYKDVITTLQKKEEAFTDTSFLKEISSTAKNEIEHADQVASDLLWLGDEPLYTGRQYDLHINDKVITTTITEIKKKLIANTLKRSTKILQAGDCGICNLASDQAITFKTGEPFTLHTHGAETLVGFGAFKFGLYRATNIVRQHMDINKAARSSQKQQKPVVLWFTGLSGSGKSTIANLVEQKLFEDGYHSYTLDGDNVRHGLNKDLGFTDADRVENIRRIGEVAKLMVDAGLITLVSFISPFRAERQQARDCVQDGEFIEIFIDTPIETCQERDVKGLYKKALAGEIKNFTGISSPYEAPEDPEITLRTTEHSKEDCAKQVLDYLKSKGILT